MAITVEQTKGNFKDKFRQLEEILPTPNDYRNAAGEPGKEYWQQQVDYQINVKLDEKKRRLSAKQSVIYKNNSPYTLKYLWLQLEQNRFRNDSMGELTQTFGGMQNSNSKSNSNEKASAKITLGQLRRQQFMQDVDLGYTLSDVTDGNGNELKYTIVGEQMRIDLPEPLKSNESTQFSLKFSFNIPEEDAVRARSGYEHFPDDARKGGNDIFLLAQWFPRVSAYSDYEAWHNKAFLGTGEFTLEFGNYDIKITVPEDHIVAATGELQNA
ncbi:MAG: aminopeptidase, partial [Proteobacteria bacterium]|nr:aminopeptidase [Pseudomonadota bacterium]